MGSLLGCLIALGTAACTGRPDVVTEPAVGPILVITNESQIVLPLDSYGATSDVLQAEDRAFAIVASDCMRRFGLDWPVPGASIALSAAPHARRYGIIDGSQVARFGYAAGPRTAPDEKGSAPPVTAEQEQVMGGTGERTFNGLAIPPGGCAGEARAVLSEGVPAVPANIPNQPGLVIQLDHESFARAEQDSRVRAAWKAWSDCMKEAGYDYATPWDANDDPHWGDTPVSAKEIATAGADVQCRKRTNLVGIWYAMDAAYQRRAIEQHASDLHDLSAALPARARNVAKVLAGQPTN